MKPELIDDDGYYRWEFKGYRSQLFASKEDAFNAYHAGALIWS